MSLNEEIRIKIRSELYEVEASMFSDDADIDFFDHRYTLQPIFLTIIQHFIRFEQIKMKNLLTKGYEKCYICDILL